MFAAPRLRLCLPGRAVLLAALVSAPAWAQEAVDEGAELEALLKQETELATKTRMNHDFVPGMVTVLQGDDLEALGVRNVLEALSLVPGVQSVRDLYGSPLILVRGINFIFNSGNIKILVDSVPLNQESAGTNSSILLLPIEDVERLELMRGPGSAIHGDFAYLGLLNIVTRRKESRVFGAAESHRITGGAQASWSGTGGRHLSVGLSGFDANDVDFRGPDRADEQRGFGRLSAGIGGLTLNALALKADHHVAPEGGAPTYHERRIAAEARYAHDLSAPLHLEVHAGLLRNDDAIGGKQYDGVSVSAGVDLRYRVSGHNLIFTTGYTHAHIATASLALPPVFDARIRGINRHHASVAIQDQWEATQRLTVTAGARVDDFSDIGTRFTPRLALVYKLDDRQILKTQYAEGFRSPTFFELYSTGEQASLEVETIGTAELSYIRRSSGYVARVTVFQSDLRRMLQPPPVPGVPFSNSVSARTRGVELELEQHITDGVRASANVSYVDPEDRRFTRDVQTASRWLANVTLYTDPAPWLKLTARLTHVGTRGGFTGTPKTDGWDTLDLTASVVKLVPGLTVRCGLKNAFDDTISYITALPPPLEPFVARYGGRTFWAEASYRF